MNRRRLGTCASLALLLVGCSSFQNPKTAEKTNPSPQTDGREQLCLVTAIQDQQQVVFHYVPRAVRIEWKSAIPPQEGLITNEGMMGFVDGSGMVHAIDLRATVDRELTAAVEDLERRGLGQTPRWSKNSILRKGTIGAVRWHARIGEQSSQGGFSFDVTFEAEDLIRRQGEQLLLFSRSGDRPADGSLEAEFGSVSSPTNRLRIWEEGFPALLEWPSSGLKMSCQPPREVRSSNLDLLRERIHGHLAERDHPEDEVELALDELMRNNTQELLVRQVANGLDQREDPGRLETILSLECLFRVRRIERQVARKHTRCQVAKKKGEACDVFRDVCRTDFLASNFVDEDPSYRNNLAHFFQMLSSKEQANSPATDSLGVMAHFGCEAIMSKSWSAMQGEKLVPENCIDYLGFLDRQADAQP